MLWIPFTLLAAFMQAWRNAFQKQLSKDVSVAGVTLARFIWASPLAALYLYVLYQWQPAAMPVFSGHFAGFIIAASLAQILATALMVKLFKLRNYAIGAGLAKSEAVLAAVLGVVFFSESLTLLGWFGVALGGFAVFLLSGASLRQLSVSVLLLGLGSGLAFALTSLWVRQASLVMGLPFPYGAAWVLLLVIMLQTLLLLLWLTLKDRPTLTALWQRPKLTLLISLCSCIGSVGWFTAMSLESVALVKTLGQVEVLFMLLISAFVFKEKLQKADHWGLALIVVAAIAVMWA
ncbi:drug/metabolite transporter (DMT)-like permease [Rheinheimera pacifica]|uniref:DMT family transporter n=1 Tax=Rheinheimera pacifica TaxID=173990 RepID=UPI002166FC1E|nr:DMT family transporter [Rheinheimera pacifica]MCS4309119.1 drug/metabolite transporter (DMT)-like permease [Rheinheimera pacifica]